jgi:NAD(P)-dependent dehydrogenase (short-subunit alcohol dehydrogenase family)
MPPAILITGASSGLGAERARAYERKGSHLLLLARRRDRLELVTAEARALGAAEVEVHQADVTRDGDVAHAVAGLQVRGIGLDIVYTNVGFGVAGPMQSLTVADYQRQFDTNVVGLLRTDNTGVLHADAPDPVPAWLRVTTDKAVREIVGAVERGRPEVVVTGHAILLVFLSRQAPRLLRFILMRAHRGRPEPKSASGGDA